MVQEFGTSRRRVFENLGREQGRTLESFYCAFCGADLYLTFDLPDLATAAAISLSIEADRALIQGRGPDARHPTQIPALP